MDFSEKNETRRRQLVKLQRELGPEVMAAMEKPEVEDIVLNPDGRVWVRCANESFRDVGVLSASNAEAAIRTVASIRDALVSHTYPILETELPDAPPMCGYRFTALLPPVVIGPAFAIRRRAGQVYRLDDYVNAGILTAKEDVRNEQRKKQTFIEAARGLNHVGVIREAIRRRLNILLVGSTGSGKTTFATALLQEIADQSPHTRILTIEDTAELQVGVENYISLQAIGEITMLRCLRAAMRLKPDRIIVGEVRGAEAHTLLKAWNTGHPGGIATIHADDAESGLSRLESLIAEATASPQRDLIARAVNLVVFIDEEKSIPAGRKVREVFWVSGSGAQGYQGEFL